MHSGFATVTDCKDCIGKYSIPREWWSRRYEYPWVAAQIRKSDCVLDAGCGISHFFKYWLAENCKAVTAVDGDARICTADTAGRANLTLIHSGIESMPMLKSGTFTRIVCLSVLEHTGDTIHQILQEFARILTPDGRVLVTLDIPTIALTAWRDAITQSAFVIDADDGHTVAWDEPADILIEPRVIYDNDGTKIRSSSRARKVFCCRLKLTE